MVKDKCDNKIIILNYIFFLIDWLIGRNTEELTLMIDPDKRGFDHAVQQQICFEKRLQQPDTIAYGLFIMR